MADPRVLLYCECRVADIFRDNRLSKGGQYAFNIGKHESSVDLTADNGRRSNSIDDRSIVIMF
jgi:hypothetical protein